MPLKHSPQGVRDMRVLSSRDRGRMEEHIQVSEPTAWVTSLQGRAGAHLGHSCF